MQRTTRSSLRDELKNRFFSGKAIILIGPRQVGKTTLSEHIVAEFERDGKKTKTINCDNPTDRDLISDKDIEFLERIVGDADIIFIDEGQKVKTIGQTIKLLVDRYKNIKQVLVTGSSSFNLLDQTQEALTGRKYVYTLYPLSFMELYPDKDALKISKELETHLLYGSYPDVANQKDFVGKRDVLEELASSQLYKDVLEFQAIRNSDVIRNLLKVLALQIGSEASYTELAQMLGIDKNTVEKYIDLLEKNYIIFRLAPYFSNKRTEIRKLKKIYFYDVGIRNSLIQNFNPLSLRNDVGALWENFLMAERMKKRAYNKIYANQYFWRTYDQKEIDLVEERDGKLFGYEFKWNANKLPKAPKDWTGVYQNATYEVITSENYLDFIM